MLGYARKASVPGPITRERRCTAQLIFCDVGPISAQAGVVGQLAPGHFLSKLGGSKLMRSGPSRSETFHHSVRTGGWPLAYGSQIKPRYGDHHQRPQKRSRYDVPDPFLVVREPCMHMIGPVHGQPTFHAAPNPTPYHILRLDDGAPPPLGTCYASASGQSGTRSRFADWPWEPLATRHKLGARLLAMIPVTLLPLPAAILTSNGLPNRIFPAEAVEPLATRTACPGWGLCLLRSALLRSRHPSGEARSRRIWGKEKWR
jgi:hypothetical protein